MRILKPITPFLTIWKMGLEITYNKVLSIRNFIEIKQNIKSSIKNTQYEKNILFIDIWRYLIS